MTVTVSELAASYVKMFRIFYDLAMRSFNRDTGLPCTPDEAAYAALHGMTRLAQTSQREAAERGDVEAAKNADAEVALWELMKAEMDKHGTTSNSGSAKAARLFQVLGELATPTAEPYRPSGA